MLCKHVHTMGMLPHAYNNVQELCLMVSQRNYCPKKYKQKNYDVKSIIKLCILAKDVL